MGAAPDAFQVGCFPGFRVTGSVSCITFCICIRWGRRYTLRGYPSCVSLQLVDQYNLALNRN